MHDTTQHPTTDPTDPTTAPPSAHARDDRRRRTRALLAGGLVLGLGAAVTLAAWNDSEFATGEFTAGAFNLEGSTDGTTFDDHDTVGTAAVVTFTTPFDNLAPDDVTYAPFWVRLDDTTTTGADLEVSSLTTVDGTPGNAANLSWAVHLLASATATCDAAGVAVGTPLATGATLASAATITSGTVTLAEGATAGTPGAAQQLCIVVTAGAGLTQSGSAVATWEFAATSTV